MNTQRVFDALARRYPGKAVIPNHPTRPTEIICEIDPTPKHPEYSEAIAIIDVSSPHYHRITTETYTILKGEVDVYTDNKRHVMKTGDVLTIPAGCVHYAVGNETWILCRSEPGWTADDIHSASYPS